MKKFKKIICVALVLISLLSIFAIAPFSSSALSHIYHITGGSVTRVGTAVSGVSVDTITSVDVGEVDTFSFTNLDSVKYAYYQFDSSIVDVDVLYHSSSEILFTYRGKKAGTTIINISISDYEYTYDPFVKRSGALVLNLRVTVNGSSTPSAPTVNKAKPTLTVANKGNSLRTQWNAISGASSYTLYYRSAAASSWSSTSVSGTSYNYQGTPGTLYYFQVIPKFGSANGTPSNVVSCTYVRNTTLRSTAYNSNGTVTVGWDSAAGANGYAVAKKRPTDKSYTYYYVSGTSFNDRNVVGGAQYVYQIRPYYSNGKSAAYSDWSNSKTITTLFRPTITNINTNNINLLNINWNAIKGAKGYKVAFKRSYDSAWNYRTTNSRYYNVQNPTKGATYYVQVCAISGNLAGAYSAVSSHTVGPALTKPSLTGTTNNVSGNLSWNAVNGATGYQIARKRGDQSGYSYFTTTSTSYFDSSLIKGKLYAYQVRAYSGSTFGPWSNVMTLRPIVDKPNVYLLEKYSSWIQAEWYNVPNAASYKVAYYKKGDSDWTYVDIDETEFDLYNPVSNSYYVFSFCAVGENGRWSEWTESQRIYT